MLPNAGPGLREPDEAPGKDAALSPRRCRAWPDARAIAEALAEGELAALYLFQADPLHELPDRQLVDPVAQAPSRNGDSAAARNGDSTVAAVHDAAPDRELWERALERASTVIAHTTFLTEGLREHADVVFPAEAYAEKEGTVVHPDGRLQRLRPAVARVGEFGSRARGGRCSSRWPRAWAWSSTSLTGSMASQQLFDAVPFYAGLTLEEIGGRGVRWQERETAVAS